MTGLTRPQRDCLLVIQEFLAADGVPPTYDELCVELDRRSRSGIRALVMQLQDRGYIRRLPRRARSIEVLRPIPMPREPKIVGLFENAKLAAETMEGWF